MLKFYPRLLTVIAFLCTVLVSQAQVNIFTFSQSSGSYVPITGGTVIARSTTATGSTALDDVNFTLPAGTIPFPFNFNNVNGIKFISHGMYNASHLMK